MSKTPSDREETALARGCESFFYVADPERLATYELRTFPGYWGPTGFVVQLVPELAEGLTLEHFISLIGRGRLGVPPDALDHTEDQPGSETAELLEPIPPHNAAAIVIEPWKAE